MVKSWFAHSGPPFDWAHSDSTLMFCRDLLRCVLLGPHCCIRSDSLRVVRCIAQAAAVRPHAQIVVVFRTKVCTVRYAKLMLLFAYIVILNQHDKYSNLVRFGNAARAWWVDFGSELWRWVCFGSNSLQTFALQ